MIHVTNPQMELAWEFIQCTNQNVFLTGKAGTGKTTFLHNLRKATPKRMVVVAPTGVAAINAGGVTIHSFFQLPFGPQIPVPPGRMAKNQMSENSGEKRTYHKMSRDKIAIIRSMDLLVIDEISMVRADLLDAMDEVLRRYRNRSKPFGGLQLLMIGDLQQLAPVVKEDDWKILGKYYETPFFFSCLALKKSSFIPIELKHVYRQSNQKFIDLLNRIRENTADHETLRELNLRYLPAFEPGEAEGYISLTTHNHQAKTINENKLARLKGKEHRFQASIQGEFPELAYPTEVELVLKKGAQVMFVKNDSSTDKFYFNGKIGKITHFGEDHIQVLCPGEEEPILVNQEDWQNMKYTLHPTTLEIEETVLGTFKQFPLKLAWAITIHKSQGLTFDRAIIDARAAFAHGQVYVALSRCRSLEGLILSSPLALNSIKSDVTVKGFIRHVEENPAGEAELNAARIAFQQELLEEQTNFRPLTGRLQQLVKFWQENRELLHGNLPDTAHTVITGIRNELIPVSVKFSSQLRDLIQVQVQEESNFPLQERLKKASSWYLEKMDSLILMPLGEATFETDNKTIRKQVLDLLEKISEMVHVQRVCFQHLQTSFSIPGFLQAKSRATIEPVRIMQPSKTRDLKTEATGHHPELYALLASWRQKTASEAGTDPYQVLTQRSLQEILKELPASRMALKSIRGIGKVRLKLYGEQILKIIHAYMVDKNMEAQIGTDEDSPSPVKGSSRKVTFDMFKSGKSIHKIAMERSLSVSTIENHLLTYIQSGEINPGELLDPTKAKKIEAYFRENPASGLAEARQYLGESFSFGELKWIREFITAHEWVSS